MKTEQNRINRAPVRVNRDSNIKSTLYGKPETTPEGFLVVPVIIAQKMVLNYPEFGRRELMGDDIFSDEYLKSCDGCPIVVDHPMQGDTPIDVDTKNYSKLIVGVLYDPQVDKENDRVIGMAKIYDAATIKDIQSKELVELSQGYGCTVEDGKGTYAGKDYDALQTNMVMNHMALVENGRAGNFVKVLYNNSQVSFAAVDFERIERRRVNMLFNQFKKLPMVAKEKILGRINVAPKDFFRLNEDEQADKIKNADMTDDEKKLANEIPDEPKDENPDRMGALEEKVNAQGEILNGIKNAIDDMVKNSKSNLDPDAPAKTGNEGETGPEKDLDKKVENKVNAIMATQLPQAITRHAAEAEKTYANAHLLIGESFQAIAARVNGILPEFRKEVLLVAGEPFGYSKDEVRRMNGAQIEATLDVLARNAKLSINDARRNSHLPSFGHQPNGDAVVSDADDL